MTEQILPLLGAAVVGVALGLFYFLGLWFTLQWLPGMRYPGLWVLSSFLLRLAVTLTGLYWIMDDDMLRLVVALVCLLLVRVIMLRYLWPVREKH